jgi:3D-(3,5/4)-trihydroxycyclohexane-1,2-dione acylhydrolase (decyclizing)
LQDFTTGSGTLFRSDGCQILGLNVQPLDAYKHRAVPLVADAREGLRQLSEALQAWRAPDTWTRRAHTEHDNWRATSASITRDDGSARPTDAQVIGAVQRASQVSDIIVGAAGGLPGELHKHWCAERPSGYHLEYGFSCMGYEIAGGLGIKLAHPDSEVIVMVGDGSYLMLNSEIETSVRMREKLIILLLDNGGFGCIERLQSSTGNASFNNLFGERSVDARVDFVAHARSLGALAIKVAGCAEMESALAHARKSDRTSVIVIETDPRSSTAAGGHWWDVAVPEVSARPEVRSARQRYLAARDNGRKG